MHESIILYVSSITLKTAKIRSFCWTTTPADGLEKSSTLILFLFLLIMTYPPAPWHLQGYAIQTLNFLDIKTSRCFIPSELEIVSILPGKTLGGVYLSVYQSGSILQYNELIVVAGLVRYQNQIGSWISHIYVDSEKSVAGGRNIWGLPKEMAEFTWENEQIIVKQSDSLLCCLSYKSSWVNISTWWQQRFSANAYSGLESDLLLFTSHFKSKISLLSGSLAIPHDSPFANLNIGQPWLTLNLQQLNLIADVPQAVGKKAVLS